MSRLKVSKPALSPRLGRPTWQSAKSSATRRRLLEAAVASLAELGYGGTSIATIAERARVSRGAMQFHFPSKLDAMRAVIRFIFERRIETYRQDISRARAKDDFLSYALRAYWKQVARPEYVAHQALSLAARTEPQIRAALSETHRLFIHQTRTPILDHFPKWKNSNRYNFAAYMAQFLMDGMALAYIDGYVGDAEVDQLLRILKYVFVLFVNASDHDLTQSNSLTRRREERSLLGLRRRRR